MNDIKPKEIDVREENKIGLHAIKRSIPGSIMESLRKPRIKRNKLAVVGKQNSVKWVNSVTVLDQNTYNVTVTVTDKTWHARL